MCHLSPELLPHSAAIPHFAWSSFLVLIYSSFLFHFLSDSIKLIPEWSVLKSSWQMDASKPCKYSLLPQYPHLLFVILSGSGYACSDASFEGSPSSKSMRHQSYSVAGSYQMRHLPPGEGIHQFLAFITMRSQSILIGTSSTYFSSPAEDSGSYSCKSEWRSGTFLFHLLWCCAVCWPLPSASFDSF